jgi:3-methylfumaryl-CoA hydratase
VDIEQLQQWVGKQETVEDGINVFPAQALAAALDRSELPTAGDRLPAAWHWLSFLQTPRAAATGADGHPEKGGFLPPIPFPRRMWAAGSLQVHKPVIIGEQASRTSEITAVTSKEGRSGSLVFVDVEHRVSQQGQLCIRETQNIVYRPAPSAPAPLPPGQAAPDNPTTSRPLRADPVLLFRYSALTYNSHRIHYDRNYATGEEYYPALVVHGPLLATCLAGLAQDMRPDQELTRFEFRAIRPSFDSDSLWVEGRDENGDLSLWSRDAAGNIGMQASAEFC